MEAPAWCSVTGWHATVTTQGLTVGYDTTRRVGTSIWPPVGTSTWPPVGTFSWPRTDEHAFAKGPSYGTARIHGTHKQRSYAQASCAAGETPIGAPRCERADSRQG